MASSSKRSTRGRGGTFFGKGGPSVVGEAAAPRGSKDNSNSSGFGLGSPEPLGDILGRPTIDPWYRSGERFPSVPASLQPPSVDWEWLVVREDATVDCSRAAGWAAWIDSKLANREFCDRLEQAGVLRSILILKSSNMFRDTKALRQLVRRWCPSTHTFFFAHSELTVTLEDIENHWLLPILGDQDPVELELSPEELRIEVALVDYIGRKNIALGTQAVRFTPWMDHFNRVEDASIRRVAFVAYWLSKCAFGEHPAYSIKPLYFPLVVKIAAGACFPLAPLLLGQLYTQLDLLHAEKLIGASCHIVATAFNSSIVHTFLWEHALEYITKGRKPYESRNKFSLLLEEVAAHVGDFLGDVPTVFRWVVLSSGRLQFTAYSAHRVRRQFGFNQEVPTVMGIAAGEIPTINPFLKARAFAYWSGIAPRVIISNGNRVGVYTTGMVDYWRELMAAMVEFKNSGRGDISHLLQSYTFPLPHPRLFVAMNTMTTYANRQNHPHIPAPGKMASSRGRRTASAGTPVAKEKQSSKSKKKEALSKDSPTQASKKKKTSATKGNREVLVLKTVVQNPSPAGESTAQGVSTPASKKPMRKTRARKRTFVPPAFPSAPTSIAACIAARKSTHGISKQRADTLSRVPIVIPDDLNSSSSSLSDRSDPSGAAAKGIRGEDVEVDAVEAVSDAKNVAAEVSSADESTASSTSSGEDHVVAGTSTEEDEVSMDELEAAEVSFDNASTASASNPRSAGGTVGEHATIGVVTSAERAVETTPITITSSGGTPQDNPSESGSHVDPSVFDSSPSTHHYVRRARRGSIVSTNSKRTISATIRVPTPPSPLHESGGAAPTPVVIAVVVPAAVTIQDSEAIPIAAGEVPGGEEVPAHIPDVPESVTHVDHEEVVASEDPVQVDVIPGNGILAIEETLAQDPIDDISMEDMANTRDSYDEVLAEIEDHVASA
uniref:Aminotransferase-like plant mobile domain-containing protein n=1 Tax=Fagus sylvatica TaxID=28930 RepID=A0A2N9G9C9_FAGSY